MLGGLSLKKYLFPIIAASVGALYSYSHLVENRSLSSFCIEKLFQGNSLLQRNSSAEDMVYSSINASIRQHGKPLPTPQKYISSKVYDFYSDNMQVFCWNDQKDKKQKVIFYLHGGAYINQPVSFHYKMVENIAKKTNAKVIFPIYEKIPSVNFRDVFPKMLNLYKKVIEQTHSSDQLTLMGDSAGGGLALGLALMLKDENLNQPKDIILLSPWIDISNSNPKIKEVQKFDPMLNLTNINYYASLWSDGQLDNHYVSPIHGNPENLGKLTLITGLHEILYPDIIKYHKKLVSLKIDHNLIVEPRMNHVYVAFPIPEAKKAQDKIAQIINI